MACRWVILDPKHDTVVASVASKETPIVEQYDPELDHQIVRVPVDAIELQRWDDVIDGVFWNSAPNKPTVLYVDEETLINPNTRYLRPSLGRAIRTGRNRGLGVWSASQRPKDLPSAVFTESEHFLVFRLTYEPDRQKVLAFTNEKLEDVIGRVRGHDFVYYTNEGEKSFYVRAGKR